jgi:hypothetical protein
MLEENPELINSGNRTRPGKAQTLSAVLDELEKELSVFLQSLALQRAHPVE